MATETETSVAVVAIKADLSHLLKEMKKVSPEAAAMTKDLVSAVNKNLKDLEKTYDKLNQQIVNKSKDTAKKVGKSWNDIGKSMQSNQMISDMEQIGSMFTLLGGNVSKMSMLFVSGVRPVAMLNEVLKQAFGPAAPAILGVAALPAVAAGAVMAIKGLADAGLEARDHLQEMGYQFAPDKTDALASYEHAIKQLDVTMSKLKMTIGEEVAPSIDRLVTSLDILINTGNNVEAALRSMGQDGRNLADILDYLGEASSDALYWLGVLSTGGSLYLRDLAKGGLNEATDKTIAMREEAYKLAEAQKKASQEASAHASALKDNKEWAEKAADAYVALGMMMPKDEEAAEERERLRKETEALARAERDAALATQHYVDAFDRWLDELEEADALMEKQREAGIEAYTDSFDRSVGIVDAAAAAYRSLNRELAGVGEAFEALAAKQIGMRDAFIGIANDTMNAGMDITSTIIAGYEQRAAAGEKLSEKEKKAAMTAFHVQQGLAIASAQLAAIQAAATTVAQLTAVAVPFPLALVAGVAAAAAIEASMVSQLVSMEPPEFPMGRSGSPDHQTVRVRPDEPILTPRAGRSLGADTIDALNQGEVGALGDSTIYVTLQVGRDVLGEGVASVRGGSGHGVIRASRGRRPVGGGY